MKKNVWSMSFGIICSILMFVLGINIINSNYSQVEKISVSAEEYVYDEAFDLKDVTACTATTVTINESEYNTSGNTFYISDIDGLLTLSAIVGKINTSNTGHLGCGIDNSAGVANSMAGAIIVLNDDIDYNPGLIFDINLETGDPIIKNKSTGEGTEQTPISWLPIGAYGSYPFNGIFDGDNHIISGLYMMGNNAALFKYTRDADSYFKGSNSASIVCIARDSIIINCHNTANICGTTNIGGIVADANGITITNCYNTGNLMGIESYTTIGGIVSYLAYSTVINCYNAGDLISIGHHRIEIGGIAGNNNGSDIINCYNLGNINSSGYSDIGGIAGFVNNYFRIINCYNLGNIRNVGGNVCIGGIVGCEGEMFNSNNQLTDINLMGEENEAPIISNCYNSGMLEVINHSTAGGIAGRVFNTPIINCYNSGNVVAGSEDCLLAGIVGETESSVINCHYSGSEPLDFIGWGSSTPVNCDNAKINLFSVIAKANAYVAGSENPDLSDWQFMEPYLTVFGAHEILDLKDATSCTETSITINDEIYNTNGNTFYISNIDGLLTLSAIVNQMNTTNIEWLVQQ